MWIVSNNINDAQNVCVSLWDTLRVCNFWKINDKFWYLHLLIFLQENLQKVYVPPEVYVTLQDNLR